MATFGNACTDRASFIGSSDTYFDTTNPITEDGLLTSVCVYMNTTATTGKVKVFRLNGSNYVFVGESSSQALVVGSNTFSGLNISVLSGDYIGIYNDGYIEVDTSVGSMKSYGGNDITTDTATSSWQTYTNTMSILATYTQLSQDIYINSSTGSDSNAGDSCTSGHPVQTFGKAYSLLASGGTIYVCNDGADFSAENITFTKPYNTAQGAAGITNCKLPRFN